MLFFRMLRHLLPDGAPWRLAIETKLREFFTGLLKAPEDARTYVDDVHEELRPETTRELAEWEAQFGILARGVDADRRLTLAAEWAATGGQSPRYLQDVMQAAGFDIYIHEWWASGPPYVARDPRDYTEYPLLGTIQCGEPIAQCGEPTAQCNRFLANEVGYLVNENLTREAPPPVPSDPTKWPYFLYWGGATFGELAVIDASRRDEFERLLLRICPAQQWLVVMVDFSDAFPLGELPLELG